MEKHSVPETNSPLMGPGTLALLNFVAGPVISGPVVGSVLLRLGRRRTGWMLAFSMMLAGFAGYAFLLIWPARWYWSSLSLLAVHFVSSVLVYFSMRSLHVRFPDIYLTGFAAHRRLKKNYTFVGMFGGAVVSVMLGGLALVLFLIGCDWMFALLMPVAPSDVQTIATLFIALFCLAVSGSLAGMYMGRKGLKLTPATMLFSAVTLILISLFWLLTLEVVIAVPGFLAGQSSGSRWAGSWFPFVTGNLLVGVWWAPFLFTYIIKPFRVRGKILRLAQVPLIHLSAGIALVILFGYTHNIFHAAGKYFERRAHMTAALWCYEQGLKRNPTAASASYLQYRVALLAHKLGEREKARQGFRMVVSKYTYNDELVKKSNRFLDNMSRNGGDRKRVVLPGVESHMAHKGSYCVPNSLALVMRFWGSDIDARDIGEKITGLSRGTTIVDQAWYAEQQGFRHDFLPNASLEDIKMSIDAGFPVMVYVPAHVFVIVGYDDILDTFVTYDVATSDVWVDYIQKDFVKSWKRQGATLVLAYPPDREGAIPQGIRDRLVNLSEGYLHYHLHYAGRESSAGGSHLLQAAGNDGSFFIPLAILYTDFPGLRGTIDERFGKKSVSDSIIDFFSSDFDEAVHLWGQYHDETSTEEDKLLGYSLNYLIGTGELVEAQDLLAAIEEQGPISDVTKNVQGMIDMGLGDFGSGIYRLNESEEKIPEVYLALAERRMGNTSAAIHHLVKTVDGCT